MKGCEDCFSATLSWTSPLSDRKVPNRIVTATSTTAVVDAEYWGEYLNVVRKFQLYSSGTQTLTTRYLAYLLSLLVNGREDVITGKPEASNTFLIK